ncbi:MULTISPECIES: HD domain-containing protein [unclassified Streptomyces]|uniref:HD domain-containing protein n=1 Tax=unclassified Streptomyces TaxID=2593676 RepID=UPI0008DE15A8|nr:MULTISPECIES: HD domain-containing protein [unclassified Streptomyces]OII67892.1 diguanylate cyclase [Streptomyces sp. CC77]
MSEIIAGVAIPDSTIAKEATELIRDTTDELIYHHSRRVFVWGALQGGNRGLSFDAELLYVAAMFHDLGLTEPYRDNATRFEIDGADEARKFLLSHGVDAERARIVWEAIALHTTPEIPTRMAPEIALVTAGVELDVLGIGYHDVSDDTRSAVVDAHPRPDFKRRILQAFNDGITRRPATTFGNVKADVLERFTDGYVRPNFVQVIEGSPWAE